MSKASFLTQAEACAIQVVSSTRFGMKIQRTELLSCTDGPLFHTSSVQPGPRRSRSVCLGMKQNDISCQRSSHLTLVGFRPLQRISQKKRPTPGFPCLAVLHSQVFSTSQCFIPLLTVPALFHAGSTRGVWYPSERSPSKDRVVSQLPLPS
jgi:hypothetical protein